MRRLAVGLILLLIGALCPVFPDQAQAEVKFFPIPAISTSKNDGNDFGLIVPALFTGSDGDLKYLLAPMLIHNSYVGARGTINLFRYEPGGKQLKAMASWSEKIEHKFLFNYVDPGFSNGRYSIEFGAMNFKN
ncbi:MAG TPA: hypothetical protein VFU48_16215, partial [Nitrospira sp.]|nr:hypothetical protein [Nitrospira sp.]